MTAPVEVPLRAATANDSEFACRTTHDTMREYVLATWGAWNEEEVRQRSSENISAGATQIIELESTAIGIQVVKREPDCIRLLQIFILPEYQRRGIGSQRIERLLAGARSARLPLRLRVLRVNPAFALYRRMGFNVVEATPERYSWNIHPDGTRHVREPDRRPRSLRPVRQLVSRALPLPNG